MRSKEARKEGEHKFASLSFSLTTFNSLTSNAEWTLKMWIHTWIWTLLITTTATRLIQVIDFHLNILLVSFLVSLLPNQSGPSKHWPHMTPSNVFTWQLEWNLNFLLKSWTSSISFAMYSKSSPSPSSYYPTMWAFLLFLLHVKSILTQETLIFIFSLPEIHFSHCFFYYLRTLIKSHFVWEASFDHSS